MGYRLQQAAKTFWKHCWMLQCNDCFIKHRQRYLEAIVSETACFAEGHRPLYIDFLKNMTFNFSNLYISLWDRDWSAPWPWYDILHDWNLPVDRWSRANWIFLLGTYLWIGGPVLIGFFCWSQTCMIQYWNLASYVANLSAKCWVRRTLAWKPLPT